MRSRSAVLAVAIVSSLVLSGCGLAGGGRVWIPQGPGDVAQARTEAPAPARTPAPRRATPQPAVPENASPFRDPPSAAAQAAQAAPRAPTAPVASPPPTSGYTQATRYGDLLFVSGQIAINPATNQMVGDKIEDQTRQVMENVRQILEAHRLTMANVVSVTVYLKDLAQFRGMDEAYESFFRSTLPSRSVVEVTRLPRGALVEISVIAGR